MFVRILKLVSLDHSLLRMSSRSDAPVGQRDPESLTRQGRRSRAALLRAARRVFEKRGYHNMRIGDITQAARMSIGSFYTYFDSKEDIFHHVLIDIENEVYESPARLPRHEASPYERMLETNQLYLEAFQRNAKFWAAIEEAALKNADARKALTSRHRESRARAEHAITVWQENGLIASDIDVAFCASALGAMTERCAYLWFVYGEEVDLSTAAEKITSIWANALSLKR
jgi:AcrR family transcriptional regulator